MPLAIAGVRDQVFGTDRERPLDLTPKGSRGLQA
jgi:hypothetical protein